MMTKMCLNLFILFILGLSLAGAHSELSLYGNGQTQAITVLPTERLQVIAQDPSTTETPQDWWLLASTPEGLYSYNTQVGSFLEGLAIAEQSAVFNAGQPLTVIDAVGLTLGDYYLYFGYDSVANGALDSPYHYQFLPLHIVESKAAHFEFSFDFANDLGDWHGDFVQFPAHTPAEFYQLQYRYEQLPAELERGETYAPMLQGRNLSADLLMLLSHPISGLKHHTTYEAVFSIDIASNAPAGAVGIGGAPGESVWVKAGISKQAPKLQVVEGYWQLKDIDMGNQSQGGAHAQVLGDIAVDTPIMAPHYRIKTLSNAEQPFEFTTGQYDQVWLLIATESGFGGLTRVYYPRIQVDLKEKSPLIYQSDFSQDLDQWVGDFADLPIEATAEQYQLAYGYEALPDEVNEQQQHAPMLQGQNSSDDLFMWMTRPLSGLKPHTKYQAVFALELASNAPAGALGIGGAPGESVYLKAGVSIEKPQRVAVAGDWRMNIDKGHQSQGGEDAVVLGHIAVDTPIEPEPPYRLKTFTNAEQPFEFTTEDSEEVWLVIGTDSGFEGFTRLYYPHIQVTLHEVIQ